MSVIPHRRVLLLLSGFSLLVLGWGCNDDPTGPIEPFCSDQQDAAIVTFEDANLETAIRAELLVGVSARLTCGLLGTLTNLTAGSAGIASLVGIENLTGLTTLWIRDNSITDISALNGLTRLTFLAISDNGNISDISALSGLTSLTGTLWIAGNSITDINAVSGLTSLTGLNAFDNAITDVGALSELTSLTELRLHFNSLTDIRGLSALVNLDLIWLHTNPNLSDIQPLLDNPGLGVGASVNLTSTDVSCADVGALEAKGVSVSSSCS